MGSAFPRLHPVKTLGRALTGVTAAVRARPRAFAGVALGVFGLSLLLPLAVLSLARKSVDYFTFNPWLSRLPEYLASSEDPLARKLEFLSSMALAWFIADSPVEGVEWGFIVDVPSLVRFALTSLLFASFFAIWAHRRDQLRQRGGPIRAGQCAGAAGVLTSVLGFSTSACSVMGCGVPVLPVVGLALTGVSSGTLALLAQVSRVATAAVLLVMLVVVGWLGWLAGGGAREDEPVAGAPPGPGDGSGESPR